MSVYDGLLREIFGDQTLREIPEGEQQIADRENTKIAPHAWEWCHMCGWFVRCGYCGNNCCNGGSGKSLRDFDCHCTEAYDIQHKGLVR